MSERARDRGYEGEGEEEEEKGRRKGKKKREEEKGSERRFPNLTREIRKKIDRQ